MIARITRWTVALPALAALVFSSAALAAGHPAKRPPSAGPPGGVWTCDYIAAHPAEAAAALVSCDGSVPAGAGSAISPLAPTSPLSPDTIDVAPCKYVPLGGGYVRGDDNVANTHYTPGGYNYLYWGARNDGYTVQRWSYCWHTP